MEYCRGVRENEHRFHTCWLWCARNMKVEDVQKAVRDECLKFRRMNPAKERDLWITSRNGHWRHKSRFARKRYQERSLRNANMWGACWVRESHKGDRAVARKALYDSGYKHRLPGFEAWPWHFLAVRCGTGCLTSLQISFMYVKWP